MWARLGPGGCPGERIRGLRTDGRSPGVSGAFLDGKGVPEDPTIEKVKGTRSGDSGRGPGTPVSTVRLLPVLPETKDRRPGVIKTKI